MQFLDLVINPSKTTEGVQLDAIVRDTLTDVTPRSAALALLRFADYLELIQQAGVEPTDQLCTVLFEELRAICTRDTVAL
jgi:hypothetical protein